MRHSRFFIAVLITFIAGILFIAIGHVADESPRTTYAELTPDEIELCKLTTTYIGTEYVDFLDFMHCVYEMDKD